MKLILSVSVFLVSIYSFAQNNNTSSEALINALKEANVSKITNYFDNFIDLKLPQKDEIKNIDAIISRNFKAENLKPL